MQSLRFLLGLLQRAPQLKLRLVPPPSRPHFLSPALRTRHFSTFPFPSSGSGPGKFHKGLVSAVDSFSRAICSCRPLCWCCAGERLSGQARAYPGDASEKPQRDPTRKRTTALLRPPCGCHRSTVHGELSGAAGAGSPQLLSAFASGGSQWEMSSQYRLGMRSSSLCRSLRLFSIPWSRP